MGQAGGGVGEGSSGGVIHRGHGSEVDGQLGAVHDAEHRHAAPERHRLIALQPANRAHQNRHRGSGRTLTSSVSMGGINTARGQRTHDTPS